MSSLLERHARIGAMLGQAFSANDPPVLEWAAIGFEIRELEAEVARLQDICERQLERMILAGIADNAYAVEFQFKARAEAAEAEVARLEARAALDDWREEYGEELAALWGDPDP